jgi:serine/threonine-protein kinase
MADASDEGATASAHPSTERGPQGPPRELPAVVGRYRLCGRIGWGGMGSVHLAHDDELDRMIALKLVLGEQLSESAQLRLLREAQALAKLSHPNVVAVYEAGMSRGRVFVAMELVRGETVARWALEGEPRSWREVLAVFRAAGRGLAAAHAVGLVHRDFKPSNVMIASLGEGDARVKLLDFGIALGEPSSTAEPESAPMDQRLTRTGAVLGTVPFMSPEVQGGGEATVASDVYAFCVALYQCLTRELPFAAATREVMLARKRKGPPTPREGVMPPWLWAVLVRGLAPAPGDRFATMDELLDALVEPRRRRWPWLALPIAALGAWVIARDDGPNCRGDERIAASWDASSRAMIEAAFDGTRLAYAAETRTRVVAALDGYAQAWAGAYTTTCRTHADDQQLDRAMACLDRRRVELGALVDVLAAADATVMERAIEAVHGLAPPAACAETSQPVLPEAAASALARAQALRAAGRYEDALAQARVAVADAPQADAPRLELVHCLVDAGALRDAEVEGEAVFFAAREHGDDELARGAGLALARIVGTELARPAEGLEWIRHTAALPRAGEDTADELLELEAVMLHRMGRRDEARARYEQAVALVELERGGQDADLASLFNNLGALASERADYAEALAYHQRSLAIKEAAFGENHPFVASSLANIGNVYNQLGDQEQALAYYRRADAIRSEALGPDHPEVLISQVNTAVSLSKLGRLEEAHAVLSAVIERMERVFGPDHPHVALVASNLGSLARRLGRLDEAAMWLERALAILERSEGAEGPGTIMPMVNLGNLRLAQGDVRGALAIYERARLRIDDVLGGRHPLLAKVLSGEAQALLELGRVRDAIASGERALALGKGVDAEDRAEIEQTLARARRAQH